LSKSTPGRSRLLHGDEAEDLEQVVLHDVADDAELVEVPAAALSAERLLEGDDDGGDVVTVPGRAKQTIPEPKSRVSFHPLNQRTHSSTPTPPQKTKLETIATRRVLFYFST
jgi:hypothetical protein